MLSCRGKSPKKNLLVKKFWTPQIFCFCFLKFFLDPQELEVSPRSGLYLLVVTIQVLSTIYLLKFCHCLSFLVLSQFQFMSQTKFFCVY
jgi:hypothetical protein